MQCQSTENFIGNIFSNWKNHPNITRPKPTSFQDEEFIIRHFAGDVVYNVVSAYNFMLEKSYENYFH